jgi:hypothetical protein
VRSLSLLPLGLLVCFGILYLVVAGWDSRYRIARVPANVSSWFVVAAIALMLVVLVSITLHDFCHVVLGGDHLTVLQPLGLHRWLADHRFPLGQQRDLALHVQPVAGTDRVEFSVIARGRAVRTFKVRESWLDAGTRARVAGAVDGVVWAESDDPAHGRGG